ncbi:MAG: hypothetical protein MUO35_03775 [Anaerolineales bacterium]|nr:hypothetical protein [Anaerolineales bacterium]
MFHILGLSDLLQINEPIISLDAIDVIGLLPWCEGAGEGFQDKAVNQEVAALPVPTQRDVEIAASTSTRTADTVSADGMTGKIQYASNSRQVGNLIPAFIAKDGLPDFNGGCDRMRLHRKVIPFAAVLGAVKAAPQLFLSPSQYNTVCQGAG